MTIGQSSTGRIDYLNQTRRLFNELEGVQRESVIPGAEESRRFWSDISDQAMRHREITD